MPKALHAKLMATAKRKYPGDKDRQEEYVHRTLNKMKSHGTPAQKEAASE